MTAAELAALDERIRRDLEGSGLPFHVEDSATLAKVAEMVAADSRHEEDGGRRAVAS